MAKHNLRLEKFAKYLRATGNAYQSAIKAGYSEKYAKARCADLSEKVGEKIKAAAAKEEKQIGLSREEKKELLRQIMLDGEVEVKDRLKAMDIDNRMDGEYVDKKQITGNIDATVRYSWDDGDG